MTQVRQSAQVAVALVAILSATALLTEWLWLYPFDVLLSVCAYFGALSLIALLYRGHRGASESVLAVWLLTVGTGAAFMVFRANGLTTFARALFGVAAFSAAGVLGYTVWSLRRWQHRGGS